jgi:hypothetical protein
MAQSSGWQRIAEPDGWVIWRWRCGELLLEVAPVDGIVLLHGSFEDENPCWGGSIRFLKEGSPVEQAAPSALWSSRQTRPAEAQMQDTQEAARVWLSRLADNQNIENPAEFQTDGPILRVRQCRLNELDGRVHVLLEQLQAGTIWLPMGTLVRLQEVAEEKESGG